MGEVALVTGASKGIGRELARCFAAAKRDVVLVARSADMLRELADELSSAHGIAARVEAVDLTDAGARSALHARLQADGVDVRWLVNNAGFGTSGAFHTLDRGRELRQVELNIAALVDLTHLFLPAMVAAKRGAVLNIASTAGFQAGPYMATYYATKAFVISFSEAVAYELRGTGVTVTAHCPGATESAFAETAGTAESQLFKGPVATSAEVAADAYAAMERGKPLAIHGLRNAVLAFGSQVGPRAMSWPIAAKLNRP